MKIIFDECGSFWKIGLEGKTHPLKSNDFMVLTGLRDRNDRKFHHISELMEISKLEDRFLKIGLKNLKKTPLVHSKGNSYRISVVGEAVVDTIRRNEILRSEDFMTSMKRILGFEAR